MGRDRGHQHRAQPDRGGGAGVPPRRTIEVDLDDDQVEVVRAHRRLRLADVDDVDLEQMTVDQLRDVARGRDLAVSGSKAELAARIREHDAAAGDGEG